MMQERYELAKERLSQIAKGSEINEVFNPYFEKGAAHLCFLFELYEQIQKGDYFSNTIEKLSEDNQKIYQDVQKENYDKSFANPAYATKTLGEDFGQALSFLYAELIEVSYAAFEQELFPLVIYSEVFLEIYASFACEVAENTLPSKETIIEILYFFVHDYCQEMTELRVAEKIDPKVSFAYQIIRESSPEDLRYLYRYGLYIGKNQIESAKYLASLPQETINLMADTYTEGYRIGFIKGNKDLSIKQTAQVVFPVGFERMINQALSNFENMGLDCAISRNSRLIFVRRGTSLAGYYSDSPNRQYEYDHKDDEALFLSKKLATRKLEVNTRAYESRKEMAKVVAGPAWVEVFGETPFAPSVNEYACKLSKKQQEISTWYYGQLGQMINTYIPGEERSFTIIAFPIPEIGADYQEIMAETIKLNTLDYQTYEDVQQVIIDALDETEYVCIKGMGKNQTDLRVELCKLDNPSKQTKFENCVADVNIPVGEVFTSPVLKNTTGKLHVSKVFLKELEYKDLWIELKDGMVSDYGCANFEDAKKGKDMIFENVLYHHDSLPIGEFAIGTNTVAYMMGRKYQIEDKLPILIAEKTGPHFALGDTCYSHAEDVPVYNTDGKEIIARDNEVSLLRKTDMDKAYFQCHTDITIPYDELGLLCGIKADGTQVNIIENGRFVLKGCELLNDAFDLK